jgi:hypothetical protein
MESAEHVLERCVSSMCLCLHEQSHLLEQGYCFDDNGKGQEVNQTVKQSFVVGYFVQNGIIMSIFYFVHYNYVRRVQYQQASSSLCPPCLPGAFSTTLQILLVFFLLG